MKIYYAHSKKIYNTEQEEKEFKMIQERFPDSEVICPNKHIGELGSIEPYLKIIDTCDSIACSEFKKLVGRGVAIEVAHAKHLVKPVYNLSKEFKEVEGIVVINGGRDWVEFAKLI